MQYLSEFEIAWFVLRPNEFGMDAQLLWDAWQILRFVSGAILKAEAVLKSGSSPPNRGYQDHAR